MGFIMDGLEAEAYDRTYSDSSLVARIIGYFRPKLPIMIFVAVLIILTSLLDTAFPILISRGIENLTDYRLIGCGNPRCRSLLLGLQLLPPVVHGSCRRRCGAESTNRRISG